MKDILAILHATQPRFVYTHNLADKHGTHVAVALRVIAASRKLNPAERPERVVGCEVWRSPDWMIDSDKVIMDLFGHENSQFALLGVFGSQIAGGNRYDLASIGRCRANAAYLASHGVDEATGLSYGVDMTPLINDSSLDPAEFVGRFIRRFAVMSRSDWREITKARRDQLEQETQLQSPNLNSLLISDSRFDITGMYQSYQDPL